MDCESIPGIKYYKVTKCGKVFSEKRNGKGGHFIRPYKERKGYYRAKLSIDGKIKKIFVHRLVAMAFIPNLYNKPFINHIDCNRQNNNVENLEWVTASENQKYSWSLGRRKINKAFKDFQKSGIRKHLRKFTNEQILKMRRLFDNGVSPAKIAKDMNVKYYTVYEIVKKNRNRLYIGVENDK